MPRPIRAIIHGHALINNLAVARRHAPSARVWAVVKANAYGHGIERVVAALSAARPDGFALIDLAEARRVRAAGWSGPVLLLEGIFEAADLDAVIDHDLEFAVHAVEQIEWIEQFCAARPIDARSLRIHFKINTGMNRLGFRPAEAPAMLARLQAMAVVGDVTLMTHFADADLPGGMAAASGRFDAAARALDAQCHRRLPETLANSAALLSNPDASRSSVRAGIMMYGATPFADRSAASLGLLPAMTLESRLIGIQSIAPGERVGYGGHFVAERDTRIGVIACGYADGYPRHAPGGTPVRVDSVICPLVGRVSMDMMTVDITDLPQARVGTPVELWGAHVPIDDVARKAGTIGYELMCALAARVPVHVDQ
ncbi:alanine racemase [soil metagenome]